MLEAEVHGDGDEIAAIAFDGFDLDARGCGPCQRQERDQRRQDPGARHRDRALLVLPAAFVRIEIIRLIIGPTGETRLPAQLWVCFQSDGRSTMADLASAKKTLDGLVKAYAAGDATKTASLLGTLKVRVETLRNRGRPRLRSDPSFKRAIVHFSTRAHAPSEI